MKKIMTCAVLVLWAMLIVAGSSFAEKPDKSINSSNGFPSGPHHNLNIIGKKPGFVCPEQELVLRDENGDGVAEEVPVYGNVIFVPENGEDITIVMESGKGSEFEALQTLQVLDPCATDGTEAVLQLPKNDAGYRVYARALAKPGENRRISTVDEPVVEGDFDVLTEEEVQVTPKGQVLLLDGAKSVFDITIIVCACYMGSAAVSQRKPTLSPISDIWTDP